MQKLIRKLSRKVISFLGLAPVNQIQYGLGKNVYPAGQVLVKDYLDRKFYTIKAID